MDPTIHENDSNISWLFLANIHPSLQIRVLEQCINNPFVITDTMNLWINTTPQELRALITDTNILLINESELIELSQTDDIKTGADIILSMGPEKIIVKLGSKGTRCFSNNEIIRSENNVPIILMSGHGNIDMAVNF